MKPKQSHQTYSVFMTNNIMPLACLASSSPPYKAHHPTKLSSEHSTDHWRPYQALSSKRYITITPWYVSIPAALPCSQMPLDYGLNQNLGVHLLQNTGRCCGRPEVTNSETIIGKVVGISYSQYHHSLPPFQGSSKLS